MSEHVRPTDEATTSAPRGADASTAEAKPDSAAKVTPAEVVQAGRKVSPRQYDVAVIGSGIVGAATARALAQATGAKVVILEAEDKVAAHQTGNNSGVIHSGLYYKPGSLKATLCTTGRENIYAYCEEKGIAHDRCGKVVVATNEAQIPALDELERRGKANGLEGIERMKPEQIAEKEPHVTSIDGLWVPQTGIVDFVGVTRAYVEDVEAAGGELRLGSRVTGFSRETGGVVLETASGPIHAKHLINCAGLRSDLVAKLCGMDPGLQIVPFRGEYYEIVPEKHHLVNNLIYPVPDPRFPFLGVHFTRMVHGGIEAGPNAVLSFKREGYSRFSINLRDLFRFLFYKGFWKMVAKFWKTGFGEMYRSFSKRAFVKALQGLIPELTVKDVKRGGAGVRAQALEPNGQMADDFKILEGERMIHVLNAPSPAATASMSIGGYIADLARKSFEL